MAFTPEHEELRRSLQKFIAAEINPHVDQWEEDEIFPAHEVFKKLGNAGLVSSQRNGKETRFSTTDAGKRLCDDYYAVRGKFLVESLAVLAEDELDLEAVAARLRVLSGLYEQAARNAATALEG